MKIALKQAEKAYEKDEVPIGCVIVAGGKIIARAYNQRNTKKLSTAHAEILAINKACKKIGDWRLENADIYVTLEPCPMCAGAIANSRISNLYFGAYEKKSGGAVSKFDILSQSGLNHNVNFEGGIMEKECGDILKKFFREKRIIKI